MTPSDPSPFSAAASQPVITPAQLGLLLQSVRKSRGLSQAQLARRLDMSQNRLSELERNAGTLSVDQLLAIFGQLGLQLSVQLRSASDPAAVAEAPPADW